MSLDKFQEQVVTSADNKILCLAGAGSGKTYSLLSRINHLITEGVAPFSILALTFTNAAATEMRERYEVANPGKVIPEFRTFHSFCYSLICKDFDIRTALGYSSIPNIASDEQEREITERAKLQCKITVPAEKIKTRVGLNRKEQWQVELYDKAVNRIMKQENIITFDMLNSEVSKLFVADDTSTHRYKRQYQHIIMDECMPACMGVLTDNGWYRIDRLYDDFINKKPLPLVKSYNIEKSEYEYKPITGALRSENRDIFEIHTEGLNKIVCTSNHKIYTQRGYVEAKDLIIGKDMVILDSPDKQKTKYLLNSDQYQICLGSYLGDGHIDKRSKFFTYRLQLTQGIKQMDYFLSKINAFNLSYRLIPSGYTKKLSILSSNASATFALTDDIFNCVLSDISPLGLAIWYQDDGSLNQGKYPNICAGSFTFEQTCELTDMLKNKFNLDAIPWVDNKGYSNIRFPVDSGLRFLQLISPYMHPSMQYKTPFDISNNVINYNGEYLNIGANFIDKITYVGTDTVYDITVADNHNFIAAKSTHRVDVKTGTIVHNCQDTDPDQVAFFLSFTNSNLYATGDTLQNIYQFRNCTNEFVKKLSHSSEWAKYRLQMNYRSTNQICDYANAFSATYADDAYRIEMIGQRDGEEVVDKETPEPEEFTAINLDSVDDMLKDLKPLSGTSAILCRTNKEVDMVSTYLTGKGIAHITKHGTKIPRLIDCALSDTYMQSYLASHLTSAKYGEYIRLTTDKAPNIKWFLDTYGDNPKIASDSKKILKLREISTLLIPNDDKFREIRKILKVDIPPTDQDLFGKSLLYYIQTTIEEIKSNELYVGTIHSVKGLEYDNVCVANVGSYNFRLGDEEMNNLFYVAITRAKNRLFVYRV